MLPFPSSAVSWWTQQEVLDPQAQPDDFAAANLGQLKFMTVRASSALDQWEAASARPLSTAQQGAKAAIHGMIATWNTAPAPNVQRDDFRALNAGQLKQVAALFYDRLGLPHPWPAVSADDHPMVNVGQLKQMFSFELRVMRGSPAMSIPSAVLQPAYAAWQVLAAAQAAPVGSTSEDFDGDGISNWQEYQMHPELPLFDSADKDGDRILDSVETANAPILSPLIFADAVADHDGDGVMNYEEVLLGLNLAGPSSGRADGLSDAEVLAWGLLAGVPLAPSTNAVRACWEAIDEAWIEQQGGMAFYGHWLNRTLVNNEPAGWTAFQAEFWGPFNPDAWFIQNPPIPIDLDGDDIPDMDRDGDGLPDLWEYRYQFDPRDFDDNWEDPDGDMLNNLVEFASGTNPRLADTDGDGFTDAEELAHQSDPRQGSSLPPVVLQLTGKAAHQHYPGETTPPLAVRATQAGIARMGIEVTFTRLTGGGMLSPASQAGAGAASSLTVTTGADGLAAITYTAAGEPEKAIIGATAPGVTANIAFTIGVIAVPDDFAGAGSGGGQVGGSGGGEVGGLASILPTASRLLEALFAGSDGMFLRHAVRLDKDKHFPEDDDLGWLYLGAGQPLDGVSSGGYGTIDLADPTKGVSHQRRIVFESAIRPCSRTYLVLFFQDERVNPGLEYLMSLEPKLAIKTGTLTFSAQDQKTRTITIEGSIPPEYMKQAADANGNPAVDFLGPPPSKEGDRFWMALLPVEIMQQRENADGTFGGFVSVSELRPTRWRYAFTSGNESLIDDPDQIRIRFPGLRSSQEHFTLKVGVTGITGKSSSISQDAEDVVAAWQSEDANVLPLHLVTDSTDDKYSGLPADTTTQKDDYDSDRTHLVSLGATVEFKVVGSESGDFPPIRIPVKEPDGKVEFRAFVLSPNGLGGGGQFDSIRKEAKIAHEVYEQIGVSMDWLSTQTAPFPENLPSGISLNDPNHELTDAEARTLADLLPDSADDRVIDVYYLPCLLKGASGAFLRNTKTGLGKFGLVLMSRSRNTLVLAHELGHACNLRHQPPPDVSFWLMTNIGVTDALKLHSSKRLSWQEEGIIKSTENAYYIPFH